MEAKLYGQNKGGMSINGIIKDYYAYAGENISAGDLVEYVNGVAGKVDYGESVDTQISVDKNSGYTISATKLDKNRVFIAHPKNTNTATETLYGVVCTINGATITYGEDTALNETGYSSESISTVALDENRVFIAHGVNASNHWLYGIVVTIDEDEIIPGTDTQLSTTTFSGEHISVELLPNGNVFIAHSYTSNARLYAMVVTISGTTITTGTDTQISSTNYTGFVISTCLLPNGSVFIAHSYDSIYYLYGIVCSISDTTITAGSDTTIYSVKYSGSEISTVVLPDGKVFIAHNYNTKNYLDGTLLTINGTSITSNGSLMLVGVSDSGHTISTALLPSGQVLITHRILSKNNSLYGIVVSISGTTMGKGVDTQLSNIGSTGYRISSLLLDNGTIFVAHSYTSDNSLYAQIFAIDYDNNIPTNNISITEYETQVRQVTTGQFDGIAKTSGEGSPEYVEGEVEVTKTGNIFPTSGWNEEVTNTKYSTEDGYVIEASASIASNMTASNAFDNNTNTALGFTDMQGWLKITCPKPIKITKMKTYIQTNPYSIQIQGSNNDEVWLELATFKVSQSSLEEINLENFDTGNIDFYKYYKITVGATSQYVTSYIFEWQTSEYVEKEIGLIPNPNIGHKDIVSIWTKE